LGSIVLLQIIEVLVRHTIALYLNTLDHAISIHTISILIALYHNQDTHNMHDNDI
jgi:hypothetical protein